MTLWQHDETGRLAESATCPGPGWACLTDTPPTEVRGAADNASATIDERGRLREQRDRAWRVIADLERFVAKMAVRAEALKSLSPSKVPHDTNCLAGNIRAETRDLRETIDLVRREIDMPKPASPLMSLAEERRVFGGSVKGATALAYHLGEGPHPDLIRLGQHTRHLLEEALVVIRAGADLPQPEDEADPAGARECLIALAEKIESHLRVAENV
jgi:hypothetical protein